MAHTLRQHTDVGSWDAANRRSGAVSGLRSARPLHLHFRSGFTPVEGRQMKALMEPLRFACLCIGLLLAVPYAVHSNELSVADTLKQLEQDMGDAIKSVDAGKLSEILADDWSMLGYGGGTSTKESILAHARSGHYRLESFAIGRMDVVVLDNVAVV